MQTTAETLTRHVEKVPYPEQNPSALFKANKILLDTVSAFPSNALNQLYHLFFQLLHDKPLLMEFGVDRSSRKVTVKRAS
jgi:hypothetical protein